MLGSPQAPALRRGFSHVRRSFLSAQFLLGSLASAYAPTPLWYVGGVVLVLGALVVLSILVLSITRRVIDKAHPEDLPEILNGLGQVLASLACFLPWGKTRENAAPEPSRPQGELVPPTTIVAGQLVRPIAGPPAVEPGEEVR